MTGAVCRTSFYSVAETERFPLWNKMIHYLSLAASKKDNNNKNEKERKRKKERKKKKKKKKRKKKGKKERKEDDNRISSFKSQLKTYLFSEYFS